MADYEEQETQVLFNNDYPKNFSVPSSPPSHPSLDDDGTYNNNESGDGPQDVVEETQFDDLEYGTQPQDSLVPETQFDGLEKDTQAIDEPADFATTHFHMNDSPLIKRPELLNINNARDGFKFPAQPRTQNPSKRPQARLASANVVVKAPDMPKFTPNLEQGGHGNFSSLIGSDIVLTG